MASERDIPASSAAGLACLAALFLFCLPAGAHGATLMVSWAPNAEEDLAGYEIYYGTVSGQYTAVVDVPKNQVVPLGGVLRYWLEDLEPHTTYYVALTAYDYWDNVSGYSEEASCTTAASGARASEASAGAGGCFIATAAYGSSAERHVIALRGLRDDFLLPSRLGRAFVERYYSHSPPLARFIGARGWRRATLRPVLYPLFGLAVFLRLPLVLKLLTLGSLIALVRMPAYLARRRLDAYRAG